VQLRVLTIIWPSSGLANYYVKTKIAFGNILGIYIEISIRGAKQLKTNSMKQSPSRDDKIFAASHEKFSAFYGT